MRPAAGVPDAEEMRPLVHRECLQAADLLDQRAFAFSA
jgi:hypothetical protein